MNRILRTCILSKNILKALTNRTITTTPATTGLLGNRSINILKPISSQNYYLINFNRELNTVKRDLSRKYKIDDDLIEETSSEELSQSPKAHNLKSDSYKAAAKFEDFNLPGILLARMKELGYEAPFPIQAATIPHTLAGKDLVGRAITGSGKTLAFSIPIITKCLNSKNGSRFPKCLVLSPTRELCQQIQRSIQELVPSLKCVAIYGGGGMNEQMSALQRGADIVCATPGRLRDLTQRRCFSKENLELVCLDEADELLTPNFLDQIEDVLEKETEKPRQMLMFSATISHNVDRLINKYMNQPVFVDLTDGNGIKLPENVKHFFVDATPSIYSEVIKHFIQKHKSQRCIVFTNKKTTATELMYDLKNSGLKAIDLHSDHSQFSREKRLRSFRRGDVQILVATDVAARGIDVPEVDLVLQAGLPVSGSDFYIHRTGRTGRAGRPGVSITLTDPFASRRVKITLNEIKKLAKAESVELPEELRSKVKFDTDRFDRRDGFRSDRDVKRFGGYRRSFSSDRDRGDFGRFKSNRFDDDDREVGFRSNRFNDDRKNDRITQRKSFNSSNDDNDRLSRYSLYNDDDERVERKPLRNNENKENSNRRRMSFDDEKENNDDFKPSKFNRFNRNNNDESQINRKRRNRFEDEN